MPCISLKLPIYIAEIEKSSYVTKSFCRFAVELLERRFSRLWGLECLSSNAAELCSILDSREMDNPKEQVGGHTHGHMFGAQRNGRPLRVESRIVAI